MAIKLQGPRFKPRPGQKSEMRFLFHAHLCSASGTTTSGTRASSKHGNSPKKVSRLSDGSTEWVQIAYVSRKEENTNEIQWQVKKSEWKNTKIIWKAKGKKRWTPTRAEAQDTRANPYSLETHLGAVHKVHHARGGRGSEKV